MSFDETWSKATVNADNSNNDPPPEGTYEFLLKGAGAFTSKQGNDVVRLEWEVVSSVEQGYEWSEIRGFGTQKQANAAKATCHRLGVDVEEVSSLEELNTALGNVVGGYFDASVVRNGEYLNVYINDTITGSQPPQPAQPVAAVEDDDIPF